MRRLLASLLLLPGCAPMVSPELACQQRLAAARNAPGPQSPEAAPPSDDPFGHRRFAAIERKGCTSNQLKTLDRILTLTKALPGLTEQNEQAARTGSADAHMAAFQKMNDALIELNELQQGVTADLERMSATARR